MTTCPECQGAEPEIPIWYRDGLPAILTINPCHLCGGVGEVDEATRARYARGQQRRAEREAAGKGLREAANELGVTTTELALMERGELEWP